MNFQKYFAFLLILSLNSILFCATKTIENEVDFNKILKGKKPKVIKFYADWCNACQMIKPEFEKIAQDTKNLSVDFVTVQVDKKDAKGQEAFKNIISKYEVQGLPTIVFIKNGKEVDRLRGCPAKSQCYAVLNEKVNRFLGRETAPTPMATTQP